MGDGCPRIHAQLDESAATLLFHPDAGDFSSFRANFCTSSVRLYDVAISCHPMKMAPSDRFSGFYGVFRTEVPRSDLERKHGPRFKKYGLY